MCKSKSIQRCFAKNHDFTTLFCKKRRQIFGKYNENILPLSHQKTMADSSIG